MTKKVSTTVYLEPRQLEALQILKEKTGMSMAKYINQGVDEILGKNKELLEGGQSFEIWVHPNTGYGLLVPSLPEDEATELEKTGFKRERLLNVQDEQEAQARFVAWCKEQVPDAKVERVNFSRLKGT